MRDRTTVVFRVDTRPGVGQGHLMRCLTLAEALAEDGIRCAFVTEVDHARRLAVGRGHAAMAVAAAAGGSDDLACVAETVTTSSAAAVVVDGYAFTREYQRGLRDGGTAVIHIDDLAAEPAVADLVVNQNIWASPDDYAGTPTSLLLLGPRYALLRREFAAVAVARPVEQPAEAQRVLVTFGGEDADDVTGRVVGWLAGRHGGCRYTAEVGPTYPHLGRLRRWAAHSMPELEIVSDPPAFAALMARADVAVSAGGTTCWELACLGVPVLLVALAENQKRNVAGMAAAGVAESLGSIAALSAEVLAERLAAIRADRTRRQLMATTGRAMVDGQGARRVARAVGTLLETAALRDGRR